MQQSDIIKMCADSLRNHRYFKEPSFARLKSSHAHELIAAFFGYNSKNAMLADRKYPISKLRQAAFLVLPPYDEAVSDLFNQRRRQLGIIGIDQYDVLSVVKDILHGQQITAYDQALEGIACDIAKHRIRDRFSLLHADIEQTSLNLEVTRSNITEDEAAFTISADYLSDSGTKDQHYSAMTIVFPRIAGRVGYLEPDIQENKNTVGPRQTSTHKTQPMWPYTIGTFVMMRNTKEIGIVLKTEVGSDNHPRREGSMTLLLDTSLECFCLKSEAFPLTDQSINFTPLRLFIPYGKYICSDRSEVLYNRDYRPLWKKTPDGVVERIGSDLYIEHIDSKGFFNGKNLPDWSDPEKIREVGMKILKEWGVENARPQILDLLSQAIDAGSTEILKAHSYKTTPLHSRQPADFQVAYAKKAIEFWTTRPYARRTREILLNRPYGVEAQFMYETEENLKDACFDLTNRLHDYDNDAEVRIGQALTHRVLYLCATPVEAEHVALLLSASTEIRVHKLY